MASRNCRGQPAHRERQTTMRRWGTCNGGPARLALVLAIHAMHGCRAAAPLRQAQHAPRAAATHSRVLLTQALLSGDGSHLRVTVLEVTYPPGGYTAPHRHPCPVVGYVVSGALRMRVGDGPDVVYEAGQAFSESANAAHLVSANAHHDRPATFLATFACDR